MTCWSTLPLGRSICPQWAILLSRVKNAQLTLRPTKCSVGFSSVSYLGHYVGNHPLQTKSDLVEKIPQAPKPTNKQQVRSFLGLIGFYRKLIPNFATSAVPLTDLRKKAQIISWSGVKPKIELLRHLRVTLWNPQFWDCLFLRSRIGAILVQEESGVKHPVAFASRKLLTRESHYSRRTKL